MNNDLSKRAEVYLIIAIASVGGFFINNTNVDDVKEKDIAQDARIDKLEEHANEKGHPDVQTDNIEDLKEQHRKDIEALNERVQYLERLIFMRELSSQFPPASTP